MTSLEYLGWKAHEFGSMMFVNYIECFRMLTDHVNIAIAYSCSVIMTIVEFN
jgi:hypothetical protein